MLGKRLSHYRIVGNLGAGGMGVVYKAWDEKLGRPVAIKILRSEYAQSQDGRRRFLREARAVAAVSHPYVATIHDADEQDGTLFIAMEYVEGSTLRELLKTDAYSTRDMLQHCCEIAEGLAHVHAARIIHRDLKPGNIMVSKEGHAKILDFGLAKLVEERDTETKSLLTSSIEETSRSTRLGTPAYMAPEQVRGSSVDHRTDVFAFGCTLFEAFTRKTLFGRPSQGETLAAILRDEIVPASSLSPEVPQELDWILERCLAKEPRERYQDTRDLVVDLDHLRSKWETGSLTWRETSSNAKTRTSHVDTLPLEPPAPDPHRLEASTRDRKSSETRIRQALLRVWKPLLVGAILLSLSIVLLRVLPDRVTQRVFYERGIHYLREESESVASLDNAIQMFHRALARDSTSVEAWAGLGEAYWIRFQLTKSEASQEEAERAVSHALELDPNSAAAANAQGRGFLAQARYEEARESLERAVRFDDKLDAAWANLGRAHQGLQNYAEGLEAIQKSIALKPNSFRHHISLGNFYRAFREREAAIAAYRQAIEIKPNSNYAWNNLGSVQILMGSFSEAADSFRRSLEIVNNATARSNLGTAYYFMGDFEAAEQEYREASALEPQELVHYENRIDALIKLGKQEEIQQTSRQALDLAKNRVQKSPQNTRAHMSLAILSARAGDSDLAVTEAARCVEMEPEDVQILFLVSKVHCILGRLDDAIEYLERASRLGLTKVEIVNDPDLEKLRGHPRYQRILSLAS